MFTGTKRGLNAECSLCYSAELQINREFRVRTVLAEPKFSRNPVFPHYAAVLCSSFVTLARRMTCTLHVVGLLDPKYIILMAALHKSRQYGKVYVYISE